MSGNTKRRKNIALFMAMLENEFSAAVLEGAVRGAKEADANLLVFPVGLIDGAYSDKIANNYRYQYNALNSFLKSESIDGAVIEYGTIVSSINDEMKKDYLSLIGNVPVILLSEEAEGYPSICVDNRVGLKEVINHLIDEHGCKNIGFVSGPENNHDAQERLDVFKETLCEKGLYKGDDWITYGNFSVYSELAVRELLNRHPEIEAIVFANDHMALGAYDVLRQMGREPGKDILVTGFDNIPSSLFADPSLTTVVADTKHLSEVAVIKLANGDELQEHMYVNTHMLARESCGCSMDSSHQQQAVEKGGYVFDAAAREKIIEGEKRKEFVTELGNILREMVYYQDSNLEWYASVLDIMKRLDFGSSYLFLYDDCIYHRNRTPWNLPGEVALYGYYAGDKQYIYENGDHKYDVNHIFNQDFLKKNHRFDMVVTPLFFRENQYGFMLVESNPLFFQFAFQIASQISSTLEFMRILTAQEKIKRELEYANKSKSQFLANMSHEIRTPINAILGMDEMILRESENEDIDEYAVTIKSAATSLLTILNDILDVSKIEVGKMTLVPVEYSLYDLIHGTVSMLAARAENKGLSLELYYDENLPSKLFGDDVRIRQVILNLLSNAVKYTESGTVTVNVTGKNEDDYVILYFEVKDTGIGMKKEDLNHLFGEYERIDERRNHGIEGTGLGMSIVKGLLELMDSSLKVESEYNYGSTFSFSIRQKIVDYAPIGVSHNQGTTIYSKEKYKQKFKVEGASLLLVDDNEMNRVIIKKLLKRSGLEIYEADSGFKCLEMVKKRKYDIILLDQMMPDMTGTDTFEKIKKIPEFRDDPTPVIMVTADVINGNEYAFVKKGFSASLSKPVDADLLDNLMIKFLPREKVIVEDVGLVEEKNLEYIDIPKTTSHEVEETIDKELILIIDDNNVILRVVHDIFDGVCDTVGFNSGIKALEYLETAEQLPDLVLLDTGIRDIDAYRLLAQLKTNLITSDISVVMTSYDSGRDAEIKCFEAGATDFFIKPFVADIMRKRVKKIMDLNHLQKHLEDEVKLQTMASEEGRKKVERLSLQAMTAMAAAIDAKDKYTNGHSERVAKYSRMIAMKAGKSRKEIQDIYYIGLLHDVGKIGVPDGIINKKSRLTDEEFAIIKTHPVIGADILKNIDEIPNIAIGAHWHHERFDGRGYPDGLKGEDIPEIARIIGVADAYDAMTSSRSYRERMPQEMVRKEIESGMGSQFDPYYAGIMLDIIDKDVDYQLHE